jgi:type IV secretory pathway protease TraF
VYFDKKETYVPHGKIFLIGDNLNKSIDSRDYGAVPLGLIKNRVFLKVKLYLPIYSKLFFMI